MEIIFGKINPKLKDKEELNGRKGI